MSIAAYNRGTRAMSRDIDERLREARRSCSAPSLPVGWTVIIATDWIEVRDVAGDLIHAEPIPYFTRADPERAVVRALDPCLGNPRNHKLDSHALNGWQLT